MSCTVHYETNHTIKGFFSRTLVKHKPMVKITNVEIMPLTNAGLNRNMKIGTLTILPERNEEQVTA